MIGHDGLERDDVLKDEMARCTPNLHSHCGNIEDSLKLMHVSCTSWPRWLCSTAKQDHHGHTNTAKDASQQSDASVD
jgi:hypothetical protein